MLVVRNINASYHSLLIAVERCLKQLL
jgi:hypothetical protein